jgi:two-component system chemotaxis response regulator CheY
VANKQKKLKILLIEDNGIYLNIVSELLVGHTVKGAKTAAEGMSQYKKFHPDITFLDISLPDGNGHDLLMQIKNLNTDAYVVMMTASRLKEDILKSMDEGAQGYVVKPFASDMLNECIKEYYEYKGNMGSAAKD